MKRIIIPLIFLTIMAISCQKGDHLKRKSLQEIVFQGKYLGEGCWPVIQVIEPSLSNIGLDPEKTIWRQRLASGNDTLYHNAVGARPIPATFMNGDTFYFIVSKVESDPDIWTNGNCLRTKYLVNIKTISFTKTKLNEGTQ